MKIADIIGLSMLPPTITKREGKIVELTSPGVPVRGTLPYEFERSVMTFLFDHRRPLGIAHVFQAKNLLVDGGLALEDGCFIAVEIKYRMNWPKACQTGWQFGEFTRSPEARQYRPVAGIVFFGEFSGDWARLRGQTERGWLNWYAGHVSLPGDEAFRVDLVRFRHGQLETMEDHRT